ncbi:ABC transporter ATP-binding protein [Paenibacillus sp. GCM10023248]|uniref:ABC transporter ATP-binding protein n=1 Tax=unclassified Paenibacillus TaxID=185978 RepID=UPI0023790880|nr:ABC transporter ATP-binding protein [Paenibacillus sp. MAHUQ-63]MDD9266619.1 ABC transporter ATP-binding protein [Paenibacillus sp. MAHUQ-63]
MSSDTIIEVNNISKCYQIFDNPKDRLKQIMTIGNRKYYDEFWALQGVEFQVQRGEAVGILGRNGSGKSTLLQIISGTLTPTSGNVNVKGRVAALLELGSGFNPEYTGRENVYLNGNILGLSRKEMDTKFDDIAAFADIGNFIEQPVKTYSSGMMLRLAFAVQACIDPDVLIVDEALAVGDMLFQKRCFSRMKALIEKGTTLLFVTHDVEMVRTFTSRAVLLERGKMVNIGPSANVVLDYRSRMHQEESAYYQSLLQTNKEQEPVQNNELIKEENSENTMNDSEKFQESQNSENDFGDKDAVITQVRVLDNQNKENNLYYPGDEIRIEIQCKVRKTLNNLNIGVRLRNKTGAKIYSWGTLNQDVAIWSGRAGGKEFWSETIQGGTVLTTNLTFSCSLGTDLYEIQAYVTQETDRFLREQRMLHWLDEAAFFQVSQKQHEYFFGGICDLRMKAEVKSLGGSTLEKKGFVM